MLDLKDSIVFVPRCGSCGYALINEDQIRNEEKSLELFSKVFHNGPDIPETACFLNISECPKCHAQFKQIVIPMKNHSQTE